MSRSMIRRSNTSAVVVVLAAIAATAVAGCGSSSSGGSSGSDAKVAVAAPLSGPDAAIGTPIANGAKLAVEEAQAAGGLPGKLTADVEDDQEKPEVGATLARKFCGDQKVIGAVADLASSVTLGTQPVYNGCGLTQVTPTASADELTAKGYKQFFRMTANVSAEAGGAAKYLRSHLPNVKTAATIDANDSTTTAFAKAFAAAFQQDGGTVVDKEHVTSGNTDFRGVLTKIIAGKPDAIHMTLFLNDAALVVKQARELGYKGPIIGVDADVSPDFVKLAGGKTAEGVYMTNLGLDPTVVPSAQAFAKAYQKRFGTPANAFAAAAYDAARVIIAAWKTTGSTDRAKITAAVAKTKFAGTQGPIAYDAKGDLLDPVVGMFQVKGGKIAFVGPAK